MIFCTVDQPQIIVMNSFNLRIRATGNNLYRISSGLLILWNFKQRILLKQIFFRSIVPIQHESYCQRSYRCTFNAQMRISPIAEFFLIHSQILSSYIETTYKSYSSINDNDLAVIPVIHPKLQLSEQCREKLCHVDSFTFQALPVPVTHPAAPHTVK